VSDHDPMSCLTPLQQARRGRILQTARDQLSRNGYDGINMRDLAAAANVSPTTLYNLYENKDVLILSALQEQLATIGRQTNATPRDGWKYLLELNYGVARQIVAAPQWAAAITRLLLQAKPDDPILKTLLIDAAANSRTALHAMQEAGELKPETDVDMLCNSLTGASWSTIILWTKEVVALENLPREYMCNLLYPLLAAATPRLRRRLNDELNTLAARRASRATTYAG